jgi:phage terminase large subunit
MATIYLPYKFTLRDYQVEPWNAMLLPDYRRGLMVVPRRNGKDILCWNALIAKAMQRPALYYYVAPYYNQIRQIIWEGFDKDGRRFLDYIPKELIKNMTKLDMRIDLINGSQIKLQGSDEINRIVGTNPFGIIFTEFSLHKPAAWEYLRPILAENGGWAMFNGTPRGMNHFYEQYLAANSDPKWFCQYLTRDDTGIPTLEAIEEDRKSGMPEELIQQEYYCSFLAGEVGSYYGDLMQMLRNEGHMCQVPWDPKLPVYTSWDLGVDDSNSIWFAQAHRDTVRLIDYYEDTNKGLQHYIKVCQNKPYVYGGHFAPHDITVREYASGEDPKSRWEIAMDLGFEFEITKRHSLADGHEVVRSVLPRCYWDQGKTADGVASLMGYKKKFNSKLQSYSDTPERNRFKHGADSFRILAYNVDNMVGFDDIPRPVVIRSVDFNKSVFYKDRYSQKPKVIRAVA